MVINKPAFNEEIRTHQDYCKPVFWRLRRSSEQQYSNVAPDDEQLLPSCPEIHGKGQGCQMLDLMRKKQTIKRVP